MRFACLLVLLLASPLFADPAPLHAERLRDGWVKLFDGESLFGWSATGDVKADAKGLSLPKDARVDAHVALPPSFELDIEATGPFHVRFIDAKGQTAHEKSGTRAKAKETRIVHYARAPGAALRVGSVGAGLIGGISMTDVAGLVDTQRFAIVADEPCTILRVELRLTGTTSLFNGKDLDGWDVFPGKKSKFSVEAGAIRVVDGPGDLQTKSKHKNFYLQFECQSHGKGLNSGLFFRCRPNEYQNGYEAQVQNDFSANPAKVYAVEVYDPKTRQLVEKRKMTSSAVDFGTGAIYRRVPARVGVAKDGEWFAMTVYANGNHLATWVNGVPVVDWRDNRPAGDNARTGFRAEGGHLSLQGHDPTTNLSFRGFRVASLPD